MWHKMHLAALDAGKKPLLLDQASTEGPDLLDLVAEVGTQLHHLVEQLRGTDLAFLEGFGYLTIEVQRWASLSSYEASGEAGGKALRVMRAYATHALYYGPGSPRASTGTGLLGSFRN